jgi:hypothetical protein
VTGSIILCKIGDLYQLVDTQQTAEQLLNTKLFVRVGYYMIIQKVSLIMIDTVYLNPVNAFRRELFCPLVGINHLIAITYCPNVI